MKASDLSEFLRLVYGQFTAWERYKIADDILHERFHATRNHKLLVVYEKVVLLDRLYGTNVFHAFRMAEHIVRCKIDPLLKAAKPEVICRIRAGHDITAKQSWKEKDLYSFASKYASWHRPDVYPIYDGLIGRLLPKLNRKLRFHNGLLSPKQLRTYSNLIVAIDELTEKLGLESFRYKKIDKALWLWAKYEFRREHMNDEIKRGISKARKRLKIRL